MKETKQNLYKVIVGVCALVLCVLFSFTSCATYMPLSQVPNAQELGPITANFEINIKTGVGFLGDVGGTLGGAGGGLLFVNPLTGVIMIGTGLGLALAQDLFINVPKKLLINIAAREALLTAARQKHTEDIDVRDIRYTYVQPSGRTYLYNATGVVIKKEN